MSLVRSAAVAGSFYPENPIALKKLVSDYLDSTRHDKVLKPTTSRVKAVIVPHAGYRYSGRVAAAAYAHLSDSADSIDRIVLIGPSHHIGFRGLAVSDAMCFQTPLGKVNVDTESVEQVLNLPQVHQLEKAHLVEHSLEVQLPFLKILMPHPFSIVPLVVGQADTGDVAEVMNVLWGGPETLLVVSSDLSHYHDYETATQIDQETVHLIETLHDEQLSPERACGYAGIQGLLQCARERQLAVTAVDVRNSGDTAGSRDQVVGYGAFVVHE